MTDAALEARNVSKSYGHVTALDNVTFTVRAGEVVALIGDNGAGKSALVKILSGTESPTAGELLIDGEPVTISGPMDARRHGVETVYQDLALAPHLNPVQNMYLGREVMRSGIMGRLGFMDNAEMLRGSKSAFADLGATVRNYAGSIGAMSGGQKQAVAVARAAAWAKKVICLTNRLPHLVSCRQRRPRSHQARPRPWARGRVHKPFDATRHGSRGRDPGVAARAARRRLPSPGHDHGRSRRRMNGGDPGGICQ